jgi:glutamine amidotransferase
MALKALSVDHVLVSSGEQLQRVGSVLLPGVGSFKLAMSRLNALGLAEPLRSFAAEGKTMVGICLGMQLLFESSDELEHTKGLGILSGHVIESPNAKDHGPAFGWETVQFEDPLQGLEGDFYFAHSHEAQIEGDTKLLGSSRRDGNILVAGVRQDAVIGFQFHPEKSGEEGLSLLKSTFALLGT